MLAPVPEKPSFSTDEMKEALSSLSDTDMLRLSKIARRYSKGRIDPDDLLQQAFVVILDGSRKCPRDIAIMALLAGTLRSLASSRFKSLSRSPELQLIAVPDDDCDEPLIEATRPSDAPNPDQVLISEQDAATIHGAIFSLFADDEIARLIVEGDMEEMDACEIQELTGLDKTAYNSKRRLIRRRIDKAYPEGWKL